MSSPSHRFVVLACALLLLAACDDGDGGGAASLDGTDAQGAVELPGSETTMSDAESDPGSDPDGAGTDGADAGEQGTCDDQVKPFGCACSGNVECRSGWCLRSDESLTGLACTRTCASEACPEGYRCTEVAGGGDPISICEPMIEYVCNPCANNSDCGGAGDRCLDIDGGRFCGQDCSDPDRPCPAGYDCAEVTDEDGDFVGEQCLPSTGSCTCPPEVDFETDPDNCGTCQKVCSYDHAVAACSGGECELAECEEGWVDLDGDPANGCEYECTRTSETDVPDVLGEDANCDGLDGEVDRGIFVAPSGSSNAAGTREDPYGTISKALSVASPDGRDHVYVAGGSYPEQVIMVDGVSVFGGYGASAGWERRINVHETIISDATVGEQGAIRAVIFEDVERETVLGGVTVQAANNPSAGGSSYAVWMRNVGPEARIVNSRLVGGSGGGGQSGSKGTKGGDGAKGQRGGNGDVDCRCNEPETYQGTGGAASSHTCPSGRGSGGDGADGLSGDDDGRSGDDSPDGTPGGGPEADGEDGDDGDDGAHGSGGFEGGVVSPDGFWSGADGEPGGPGADGAGGGGGGSGDGREFGWITFECPFVGGGVWGGGGGGGGSGGCGGSAGGAGTAGGGSFGVFVVDGSPTLVDNVLSHKSGGNGGNGGVGGGGGIGKAGGKAGSGKDGSGDGGKGGDGGDGGAGGHGGGGAGGIAYGLYLAGSSGATCEGNIYEPLGSGGIGGIGGDLDGDKGAQGTSGADNVPTLECF